MTAVTQCPQCGTRFRVVPDQLKVSHGWVRCGKCAEVFNAREALDAAAALKTGQPAPAHSGPAPQQVSIVLRQQEPALPPSSGVWEEPVVDAVANMPADGLVTAPVDNTRPAAAQSRPENETDWAVVPPSPPSLPTESVPHALAADEIGHLPAWLIKPGAIWTPASVEQPLADPVEPAPTPVVPLAAVSALQHTFAAWVRTAAPAADALPLDAVKVDKTEDDAELQAALAGTADDATAVEPPKVDIQIDLPADAWAESAPAVHADLLDAIETTTAFKQANEAEPAADVGFIRQARRQAAWHSGSVRAALGALVIFGGALLALQVAVHERDRLAALAPTIKPWLVQLCEPIGCEINPYKDIEAVEIVSTELVRAKDGGYRFEIGLRNQAGLPVAMPAVELSLTNRQGEAVVRRVVLPNDWVDAPAALLPSSETSLTLRMVLVNPDELRTEGFRAVVFYP